MHLSRAIVPAEKFRLFSRKNEDKKREKTSHMWDLNPHIHTRKGVVLPTCRLTGAPKAPSSFKYLNVSFFKLSAWYSHVYNTDICILNPTP